MLAAAGGNVTLPCQLHRMLGMAFGSTGMRVKWTKLSDDGSTEEDVLVSMGFHKKSYGSYNGRIRLQEADQDDASLVIENVARDDMGKYRCEVIDGMDDTVQDVTLEVTGQSNGKSLPFVLYLASQLAWASSHHFM